MIRKLEMRRRHFNLRHVTRRAIFIGHRTTLPITRLRILISKRVTLETALIVVRRLFTQRLVRIMTCGAGYPSIIRITLAAKNPVWLKANVIDLQRLQARELLGPTMTRRAKLLRQLVATHQTRIEDRCGRCLAGFDGCDVLSAWSMTRLAAHAVREIFQTQLRTTKYRVRRMTTKTTRYLVRRQ